MATIVLVKIDRIEILENFRIQVREYTLTTNNGEFVSKTFKRYSLAPVFSNKVSAMLATYIDKKTRPKDFAKMQDICKLLWTNEVVNAFNA